MDALREPSSEVYRAESRRVLATLIRLLGDFDLAEEAHARRVRGGGGAWPRDGVPANPRAWLVSAGRFKAIDADAPARAVRRARSATLADELERRRATRGERRRGASRTTGCG